MSALFPLAMMDATEDALENELDRESLPGVEIDTTVFRPNGFSALDALALFVAAAGIMYLAVWFYRRRRRKKAG